MATTALACRHCGHDAWNGHGPEHGCASCSCMASPGEANPRTEAETARRVLDSHEVNPAPVAMTIAERLAPVLEPLVSIHGAQETIEIFTAELKAALLLQFPETE